MYSFSKSPRPSINVATRRVYCDRYYDLPSSVSMTMMDKKRTPSFGVGPQAAGHRVTKEQREKPAPGTYHVASSFDANKSSGKGH